jgi:hypothetical protein
MTPVLVQSRAVQALAKCYTASASYGRMFQNIQDLEHQYWGISFLCIGTSHYPTIQRLGKTVAAVAGTTCGRVVVPKANTTMLVATFFRYVVQLHAIVISFTQVNVQSNLDTLASFLHIKTKWLSMST